MKKVILIAGIIAIILIVFLSILVYFNRPSFELINHTQNDIKEITVFWRDKTMKISGIKAGERENIYINSEAAAKFTAVFTDSKTVKSGEIYFTGGTKVIVDIYDNEIKLTYHFQKKAINQ